jgi:hypothetical protein
MALPFCRKISPQSHNTAPSAVQVSHQDLKVFRLKTLWLRVFVVNDFGAPLKGEPQNRIPKTLVDGLWKNLI